MVSSSEMRKGAYHCQTREAPNIYQRSDSGFAPPCNADSCEFVLFSPTPP